MSQDPPVATFDPALPLDLDKMRDALGDINVEKPLFPDVTYEAKLAEAGGAWRLAAAAMARSLAARAAKQMESFSAGSQPAIAWGNRTRRWLDVAAALEQAHAATVESNGGGAGAISTALPTRGNAGDRGEYSNGLKGWR